jgi:hypothetical protein
MFYCTQGELLEAYGCKTTVISSQATGSKRSVEGSETRGRAISSNTSTSALLLGNKDDDIVRHSGENRRTGLNSQYNCCEEHNEISSYGVNPDAGFIDEGDLPEEDDSSYERKFAVVKYLGTTRKVTHVMSLVNMAA